MRLISRIIRYLLCSIFGIIALFSGISFVATLTRAITQPHLESAYEKMNFMGYYLLSFSYGGACVVSILTFVLIIVINNKKKKSNNI